MANAKKCDVCGKYYDPVHATNVTIGITTHHNNSNFDRYYDLCIDCIKHFKELSNSYKTKESDKNE